MPTLLQVNVTSNWGSTGKIVEAIGIAAKRAGWKSYVAYGRHCSPSELSTIKIGDRLNVLLHYVVGKFFDMEGLASKRATRNLIEHIRRIKPDIVQLHNLHDHYLNYQLLFSFLNGTDIKVVWSLHDCWAFTGHCTHFVGVNCNKWQSECNKCPQRFGLKDNSEFAFRLKKRLFLSNESLHLVVGSEWLETICGKSFFSHIPTDVIYNGVNLDVFKPTSGFSHSLIDDGKFIILAVSSYWGKAKGIEDFIKMSKLLNDDELIVLVGVSDSTMQKLPVNVIGLPLINDQKMLASMYTRADVVVSLSSAETFGLTIVEGFACGTPAVVYNNTAQPYLITTDTGFVAPDGDYITAYDCIRTIRSRGSEFYRESCLEIVHKKYNTDNMSDSYIKLYESILKRN